MNGVKKSTEIDSVLNPSSVHVLSTKKIRWHYFTVPLCFFKMADLCSSLKSTPKAASNHVLTVLLVEASDKQN